MNKYIKKAFIKTVSMALSAAFLAQCTALAAVSPEYTARTHEVTSHTYTIADGVTYTQTVLKDDTYGYQRTYKIEYTPGHNSEIYFASGEKLYSAKSMQTLLESAADDTRTPVGAINADFFNTKTGVPVSAYIRDGILYTTDLDNFCFAIDNDGKAFFDKPQIKISMKHNADTYGVIIMNKEYVNYSTCLYTDIYSSETKITNASTELVMYQYSEVKTPEELLLSALDTDVLPEDYYLDLPESGSYEDEDFGTDTDKEYETQSEIQSETQSGQTDETAENDKIWENGSEKEVSAQTDGQPKAVNPEYEKFIAQYAEDGGYKNISGKYYIIQDAEPKLGQTIDAVVTEVRINPENGGTHTIPNGALVLASDNTAYGHMLAKFKTGDSVSFEFAGNEKFYNVKQAIGCGCIIVKDGNYLENTDVYHYKTANPRSAVGITADGRIILFAVDGRQSGVSTGMRLKELAEEMMKAGCVYAANLDGGGSTAMKAYLAFDSKPYTVNKPSDSSERRVANAIVVTNNAKPTGKAAYSYFNKGAQYVLPDSAAPLGYTYYTDENHYYVDPKNVTTSEFSYDAGNNGIVRDGYYYPGGFVGRAVIYSNNGDNFRNEATAIVSADKVDSIYITAGGVREIYVGETVDFDAGAKRYSFDVYCDDESFTWSVSPEYGYIFENGLFFATSPGDEVEITASYNGTSGTYKIKVKEPPFADISGHWSATEVCKLYDAGIVVGEMTENGRMFFPDRAYSRNEFCIMLSRIMGLTKAPEETRTLNETQTGTENNAEQSDAVQTQNETENEIAVQSEEGTARPEMSFADTVLIPDWAYDGVYTLYDRGLLSEFVHADMMFDGSLPVTRREVISVVGKICAKAPDDYSVSLSDVSEKDADYQYVKNVLYSGIFEGYEDGTLGADRMLTRAEGAAVFTRLSSKLQK